MPHKIHINIALIDVIAYAIVGIYLIALYIVATISGFQLGGSAPESYDRYVKVFMAPFVDAVIQRSKLANGDTVLDVACGSADSTVSKRLAPEAVSRGALVIDDGSAFRMDDAVPLVVPEVNGADVEWHSGIISIPNCTTTPLVMALAALRQAAPITRVTAATYQAVTGTGAAALQELQQQTNAYVAGEELHASVYPHQIAMNVLPHVDDFFDDGYTGEEHKMINETRKIMHLPDLPIATTCVRVPVPTLFLFCPR